MLAVLASVMLVSGMMACGKSSGGKEQEKEQKKENENVSGLDWSAGADASGGKVVLKVRGWRHNDKAYYDEIIRRFEEKYDWIDVDMVLTADSASYYSNLQADLAFNEGVDVFDSHPGKLATFASDGVAAPQTDFKYVDSLMDSAKQVTFIDGQCYGYPNAHNYLGFMYNVDVFKKEGLAVPQTPEELVEVVNKLKAAGYGGISYAGGHIGDSLARAVLYSSLGLDGFEKMGTAIDSGALTDISQVDGIEDVFNTLTYYADNNIYYNAFESTSFDAGISLFAQKKTAIIYGGSWAIGEKDYYFPGLNVAFFPVPTKANTGACFADCAQISVINAHGKNLGAAKLWVEFLASPEISEYYCSNAGMMSNIKGINITHEWQPDFFKGDYVLESNKAKFNFYDYWGSGFQKVLEKTMFAGGNWNEYVKDFEKDLKTLDLKNK